MPAGVTHLQVTARGAGVSTFGAPVPGSLGAVVEATITVTPNEVLNVYVGGTVQGPSLHLGGYNGGGSGGTGITSGSIYPNASLGGGGATDIRRGGTALANRILVAGGGGGAGLWGSNAGGTFAGGAGGSSAQTGTSGTSGGTSQMAGGGATQSAGGFSGGTLGQGGSGGGGGGGGGYYGGGAGSGSAAQATGGGGGGGGSSYVAPAAVAAGTTPSYSSASTGAGSIVLTPVLPTPTISGFAPGAGPVGTTVTITGTNFSGATAVSFNGTAATTFSVTNATTITATVPTGATAGPVAVTTPGGTATSASSFGILTAGPATTISYSGAPQTYTVPAGVTRLQVTAQGAGTGGPTFGRGALVTATLSVVPGEVLTLVAGGIPGPNMTQPGAGGYNGGGAGGNPSSTPSGNVSNNPGGGGAGATDVRRIVGASSGNPLAGGSLVSTLSRRLLVAGGAGGAGVDAGASANNGSLVGAGGAGTTSSGGAGGVFGSTHTAAAGEYGTLGQGGRGGNGTTGGGGYGGGGGYYGGGGGSGTVSSFQQWAPGGGGSSYVEPTAVASGNTPTYALAAQGGPINGSLTLTPLYETPTLTSFSPTSGPAGTSVTLTGTGLTGATAVSFNGTAAQSFIVNSATSISATVPTGATSGAISVTTPGGSATSPSSFTVTAPAPTITGFSRNSGPVASTFTVSGTNFTGATAVTLNGTSASFTVLSASEISVLVPNGATSGPVRVTTPSGTAVSSTSFTVQPDPVVYSFSPGSGPVGTSVTITGEYFTGTQSVAFGVSMGPGPTNPVFAQFTVNSPTSITAVVPAGATTGNIAVNTGGFSGFSATAFTVTATAPTITSFTPGTGPVGTVVTITGTGLTGATAVSFNGTAAQSFTVNSATSISATVPTGATSGAISVTTPGGLATSPSSFTVTAAAPTITSLSPSSGPVTAPVDISGTNLGGATSVTFTGNGGPVQATIALNSAGLIRVNVPAGAITGPVRVTTPGGTAVSPGNYTVQPNPVVYSLTPGSGPVGTQVVIAGDNFTGAQFVSFNQTFVSAQNFTINSPTQITVNVPAGATTGPVGVNTGGTTAFSPSPFTVTAAPTDLTVSTTQNISGSYQNVTITGTGMATLTGQLKVAGTLTVQSGGTLLTSCQPLRGPGSFALQAGATLGICDAAGIRASSSDTTGAVRLTGTRSFSTDAIYRYTGSQAQQTGSGLPAQVRTLEVSNAAGVSLSQSLAVAQVLRLSNGNLTTTAGQMLTLLSSASGTALVDNTGGYVNGTGNVTAQRYISPALNAGPGYRHLASPVSFVPVSRLSTASFTPVVNPAYNTAPAPNLVTPFPTVFYYDQARLSTSPATTLLAFDKGWVSPAALSDYVEPTRGYTVNLSAGQTVSFAGSEFLNGNTFYGFSRGADAAAGWQLLGNPYPSPLDWSRVAAADRAGLNAAMYVFESTGPYAGRYRSYANGIGGNPIVPLGQGFFVRVADGQTSAALTLRNTHRLTAPDATPLLRGTADTRPQVQLALQGAGLTDAAYVYFEAGATAGVDAEYDARKLPNTNGLNLAALAGTELLAVNGLPELTAATVVPLQVIVPAAGSYTLRAEQLLNLASGTQVLLRDALTAQDINLSQQASYAFVHNGTATGRFSLVFRPGSVTATANARLADQLAVFPNPTADLFTLHLAAALPGQPATAVLYNALGQAVRQQTVAGGATGLRAEFSTAQLPAGVYTLRLTLADGTQLTKRVVKQ